MEQHERLLTLPEAAAMIRMSPRFLHEAKRRGDLPHIKFGNRVFFRPEDVKAYMEKRTRTGQAA
jgi:excisionase family DNA binding protein